ncbi:MAG: CBS domain-containing protein [Spirochaetes bacterium]|nr:CBS domain-containing protein [Spirochaetota bacterium]HOD15536.1 CBS domain-containing protein [Spirochaetota bacterium]HPG49624.1 CBS domain-containing protein [Spirochaetota bacterium]
MEIRFNKTLEILYELKVGDAMKQEVITIGPGDTMAMLNDTMSKHRLSGVPVVEGGKLVGLISISDIISWLIKGGGDALIQDWMVKDPQCLYTDQPLIHAIKRFDQLGYGRFPVLDRESGQLSGIITKGDIILGTLHKMEHDYSEEEIRQYRASHFFEDINADHIDLSLSFNIAGLDFDRAGIASTTMKKNLKRLGLQPDVIRRASIASYEAEMNQVIYGGGGTMRFNINDEKIIILAEDRGPGIADIDLAMQEGYTTAEPWVRELGFGAGMGLPNIKKCADKFEITSTPGVGTTLRIEILITGAGNETTRDT